MRKLLKKQFVLALTFTFCLSAQQQNSNKPFKMNYKIPATLALCAGGFYTLGKKFDTTHFLSTTVGDVCTAASIYTFFSAYKNCYQDEQEKNDNYSTSVQILNPVLENTISPAFSASTSFFLGIASSCNPPLIGQMRLWNGFCWLIGPKKVEAYSWPTTAGIIGVAQAAHLYENPINRQKSLQALIKQDKEQLQLEQFLEMLKTTQKISLSVKFPNGKFAKNYFETTQDPNKNEATQCYDGHHDTTPVTVTISAKKARESRFFENWNTQIDKNLKEVQGSIALIDTLTNRIVGSTIASCPSLVPLLSDKPLTRYALGYVATQFLGYARERIRNSLQKPITIPNNNHWSLLEKIDE